MNKTPYLIEITLRDWFAGLAMQGMLASNTPTLGMDEENVDSIVATEAYRTADVMMKERAKQEPF